MIHDVYYELLKFLKVSKIHLLFSLHYAVYTCGGNIHLQIMIKQFFIRSTSPSRPNKVVLKCPSARPYIRPSTKRFF